MINRAIAWSAPPISCRCRSFSKTFLDLTSISYNPARRLLPASQKLLQPPRRTFSQTNFCRSEASRQEEQQLSQAASPREIPAASEANSDDRTKEPLSAVPWYLQVEPPLRQDSPLSYRQRLPELPEDAPSLLQPILEYVSTDLGLDDLHLIDLRKLEPPPALGANLMILGTARSEKHLHVSADRMCRWLRTVHGLTPYADGLLGRNELKIKMRRKARRARLLSSVGSSDTSNSDDGVRTGWVCVNIGNLDSPKGEADGTTELSNGFVGFESNTSSVRGVIQMLTEEKREELDLESLWGGILSRQARRELRDSEYALKSRLDVESRITPT